MSVPVLGTVTRTRVLAVSFTFTLTFLGDGRGNEKGYNE